MLDAESFDCLDAVVALATDALNNNGVLDDPDAQRLLEDAEGALTRLAILMERVADELPSDVVNRLLTFAEEGAQRAYQKNLINHIDLEYLDSAAALLSELLVQ